ncbi:lipopolysaccharide biosynthesis protein [Sphingomonas cannabina]|uniref:lipopolysaccharide biosynthesis protein n=1 Tax=Sphingomonas cannabina TaxID=2899123 RepID=UPI001F1E9205|nr:lipopolysaccharide biosynthesis protein [Sphingomonas cannabina]UIJ46215.1 lipopolysaccharide biosynthesis protein [Sphingomonas cannabina]
MSESAAIPPNHGTESLRDQVRSAVLWRSGTQILGQMIAWGSTFLVIRILSPADYGLFAMTQVVLVLLNMLNGYGLASALIQKADADSRATRQLFGMLILLNFGLGLVQVALAPLAAAYFRHPQVAELLRVQALLYVTTPFIALPFALLAREMDFRKQATVNIVAAVAGAIAALAGALAGLGVWTLVVAPLALFTTRAIGMMTAARAWMWPSFDFRGAGSMARYGGLMAAGQLFWFVQSQADVFIAGRHLDAHWLGIYTTSLFLTQIFVSKFVPALNEVAFSAYARIQHDRESVARAFLTGARLVMVVAMPFYMGLAAVADPLVHVVLGPKWLEAGRIVALLALAMPFMTLQVLFAPASDACGKPAISARNSATGAVVLPVAFLIGIQWGVTGIAVAWIAAYPFYLAISAWRTLPVIGVTLSALVRAITPPVLAALMMAVAVTLVDRALPPLAPLPHLTTLIAIGGIAYIGSLLAFARAAVTEAIGLIRRRG